ncbi:MAG: AEC family transporter [bacterium]|nr:AEC family transporter [Candidatus Colisoma equi]
MENLVTVARQVAILFVLMGFGAAMRKAKFFKDNAIDGIVNVLILVVTPCLVVDAFQRPFDQSKLKGLGCAFAFAVLLHVILIVLSRFAVRHRDEGVRRPLRLAAVFSNAGFMGIPLEQAILGDAGVFYGIVYIVVFNLFIWSWGLCIMKNEECRVKNDGGVRKILHSSFFNLHSVVNPGTVGLALGAPLFFLSVKLPAVIGAPIHHMANLNTPLAMIVIGYALAGAEFGKVLRTGAVYVATFVRLVACPILAIVALYPFRDALDRNMMLAMVIAASAPVAAMVSMFAAKFSRNVDVSVAVVSGTTLLSILTMPVVIALAMQVL